MSLELLQEYQPLACFDGGQVASHVLSGKLFGKLSKTIAQQLGLDTAPARLAESLEYGSRNDQEKLIKDALRWCAWTLSDADLDGYVGDPSRDQQAEVDQALVIISKALKTVTLDTQAVFLGLFRLVELAAHTVRTLHSITNHWQEIEMVVKAVRDLQHQRAKIRNTLDVDLSLCHSGHAEDWTESALKVVDTNFHMMVTNIEGLAVFYGVMGGFPSVRNANYPSDAETILLDLCRTRMQAAEKKLTDFIDLSKMALEGIPYTGPIRRISTDVLFTCKEIVKHNAELMKTTGSLHPRHEVHLKLFEDSARRLEAMEAGATSPDAIGMGSLVAASSKLIRGLHCLLDRLKHTCMVRQENENDASGSRSAESVEKTAHAGIEGQPTPVILDWEGLLEDDMFAEWTSWPQSDAMDLSNLLGADWDVLDRPDVGFDLVGLEP